MDPTIAGLRALIVRELNAFIREVEMFPDDALLWQSSPLPLAPLAGMTNELTND